MTTYYPQDRREEDWIDINEKAQARLHIPAIAPPTTQMAEAAEMLWVMLANVSGGDWTKQSADWQEYAAKWRDNYFAAVKAESVPAAPPERVSEGKLTELCNIACLPSRHYAPCPLARPAVEPREEPTHE